MSFLCPHLCPQATADSISFLLQCRCQRVLTFVPRQLRTEGLPRRGAGEDGPLARLGYQASPGAGPRHQTGCTLHRPGSCWKPPRRACGERGGRWPRARKAGRRGDVAALGGPAAGPWNSWKPDFQATSECRRRGRHPSGNLNDLCTNPNPRFGLPAVPMPRWVSSPLSPGNYRLRPLPDGGQAVYAARLG